MNGAMCEGADWRPRYPKPLDGPIQMMTYGAQTFMNDKRPGIGISDCEVQSPACFWIDHSHIYVRANWGEWRTVCPSNPMHAAAICAARYCRISSSMGDELHDTTAPVYRVDKLPHNMEIVNTEEEFLAKLLEPSEKENEREKLRKEYQERIKDDILATCPDLDIFLDVEHEGYKVDLVVSSAERDLLLRILPGNQNFCFMEDPDDEHDPFEEPPGFSIASLDFLSHLRHVQAWLEGNDPGSQPLIGLVATADTLETLPSAALPAEIADLCMFTYDNIGCEIKKILNHTS